MKRGSDEIQTILRSDEPTLALRQMNMRTNSKPITANESETNDTFLAVPTSMTAPSHVGYRVTFTFFIVESERLSVPMKFMN
jgi:hypothetical protein